MEPFQEQFVVVLDAGVANDGDFKTVPLGKRAVIEHVSVFDEPPAAIPAQYFHNWRPLGLQRSSDCHRTNRDGRGRWKPSSTCLCRSTNEVWRSHSPV
jgi:hypothetical protein